jgi:glycosyltransferase involved in cell wall biosynthesis
VQSFADQIVGDLVDKVEIVISDNASPPDVQDHIRALYERFPSVNYYLNAKNGYGGTQVNTAPFRARGKWLWLFGDDDLLAQGGLAHVVARLERDQPDFMTVNRCVANNELTEILIPQKHALEDQNFPNFLDLMAVIGMDQLSFFSSQIYRTDIARTIDTDMYFDTPCAYAQIAYYLDGYAHRPSAYDSGVFVIHRWQPDDKGKHTYNFYHLAASLPEILSRVRDRLVLPVDLFEKISGAKSVGSLAPSSLTFADNVVQYLWTCVAGGQVVEDIYWTYLLNDAPKWRPDRLAQIQKVQAAEAQILAARKAYDEAVAELNALHSNSSAPDALKRMMTAQLQGKVTRLAEQYNRLSTEAAQQAQTRPV